MDAFMEISAILAVAAIISFVMYRLRQPLMLGYMLTGILVGPFALGWLHAEEAFTVFSEFAVAVLLFVIGLNLRPQAMREVGRTAMVLGLAQVVFTAVLGYGVAAVIGTSWLTALYIAMGVTFSSTILATKLLADGRDTGKLFGKLSIGILLVQDVIASIALILFVSANDGASLVGTILSAFLKSLILFFFFIVVARVFLPRVERMLAASSELLLLASFTWGISMAALYSWLGLSMEMGALCAGAVIASSTYQPEIVSKMKLLRDLFLVLFFVSLGSQLVFNNGRIVWLSVFIFSTFTLIVKPLVMMVIMGVARYHRHTFFRVGIQLAQVSEFSLVFALYGFRNGHVGSDTVTILTLTALISMAISTVMNRHADVLFDRCERYFDILERFGARKPRHMPLTYEAILFGSHRVGSDMLGALKETVKRYFVVDADPEVLRRLESEGVPCGFGDVGDELYLQEFSWNKVKIVVSTVPSTEDNLCLLSVVQKMNPNAVILVVAQTLAEARSLYAAGATYVIMPHFIGSHFASELIEKLGVNRARYAAERARHQALLAEKIAQLEPLVRTPSSGVH